MMKMKINLGMRITAILALIYLGFHILAALYFDRIEMEGPITLPSLNFLVRILGISAIFILLVNALIFIRRNYPFNGYLFVSRSAFQIAVFLSLTYGLFFFVSNPVTAFSFTIPSLFLGTLFFRGTRFSIETTVENAEYGDLILGKRENTIPPGSKIVIRTAGIETDTLSVQLPAGTEVGLKPPQRRRGRLCYEFPVPMPETQCELRIFKGKRKKKRILKEYVVLPLEEGSILVPIQIQIELPDVKKKVQTKIRKSDLVSDKKVLDVVRKVFTEQGIYHPIERIHVFIPTSSIPKEQNALKDMGLIAGDTLVIRS